MIQKFLKRKLQELIHHCFLGEKFTYKRKAAENNAGFTLVEIVVVVVIILILSAIILPNFKTATSQFALARSAHKLAQDIRRVAEMSMSAKEILGPTGEKIIPDGGYGIYLQTIIPPPYYEIIIFADCDGSQQFTLGNVCGTPPNQFTEQLEEIKLEPGAKISGLYPVSPLSVIFKPPSPEVFIQGGGAAAEITLDLEEDPSKTKKIKVNKAGLIDIE